MLSKKTALAEDTVRVKGDDINRHPIGTELRLKRQGNVTHDINKASYCLPSHILTKLTKVENSQGSFVRL